jgi:hypothetical protein
MEYSAIASQAEVEARVRAMALEGMESRALGVRQIESISIEHIVKCCGAAFAGVVELG